jgi:hypothetical protein
MEVVVEAVTMTGIHGIDGTDLTDGIDVTGSSKY